MDVLTENIQFEEIIKGSRFLSELIQCESQAQARQIIKDQKSKYADATHVVHAFITGPSAEIMGMSDDGEPSGTAGRPVLDVLKGRNCTNVILTVTRWFGGTLLGTGGLVKAYSGGAKQVIEAADAAGAFSPLVHKTDFSFSVDYSSYKVIKKHLENFTTFDITEDFGTEITITGKIKVDEKENLKNSIYDMSNGRISIN